MKAVNYYMSNKNIKFDVLSTMLRVPYLLMDSVMANGDTKNDIYAVEILKNASIKSKILILEVFYEHLKYAEYLEAIRNIKKIYKEESKVRHPDRQVLLAYQNVLHTVDSLYTDYIKWVIKSLNKNGMVELKGLIEDNVFELMSVVKHTEMGFKKNVAKLSPYLLLTGIMANPQEEPKMFSIANDLVNAIFINEKKVYRYSDPEATDENEVYLHKCLTIPSPSLLMASELIAVRKSLRASCIDFNNALRDWIYFFYTNQPAKLKIDWFEKEVITQLPSIQTAIDNNSILEYQKTIKKEKDINVWIGEAPLPVVWDYYKYYGIIDDDVYGMLQSALAANAALKHRIPIMVIETGGLSKTDTGLSEQSAFKDDDMGLTARKYISIT